MAGVLDQIVFSSLGPERPGEDVGEGARGCALALADDRPRLSRIDGELREHMNVTIRDRAAKDTVTTVEELPDQFDSDAGSMLPFNINNVLGPFLDVLPKAFMFIGRGWLLVITRGMTLVVPASPTARRSG